MWPVLRKVLAFVVALPAQLAIFLIRGYQRLLSPLLPPSCRFEPSCSQYAIEAYRLHGFFGGFWRMVWRLARCHPWHPGGYDPVDPPKAKSPAAKP